MKQRRALIDAARTPAAGVVATVGGTAALVAAIAPWQDRVNLLNEGLLLLLLTLVISSVYGWRVGLFAAVLTNLALNFFFVPPLHTLTVREPENAVGLVVFLIVSMVGGSLLTATRSAASEATRRQAETQVLLRMSRAMIGQANAADALRALCGELIDAFDAPGAAVLSRRGAAWDVLAHAGDASAARDADANERALAEEVVASKSVRQLGHTGMRGSRRVRIIYPSGSRRFEQPSTGTIVAPLLLGDRMLGVLRVDGPIGATPFREHPEHLLQAFAGEAAIAVQRVELMQAAAHADALRQADELKTALLTSISHDLKTPLAGIKASVSSLLDETVAWPAADRRAFLETIDSQADRLDRVLSDILDLSRLESGALAPSLDAINVRELLDDARDATRFVTGEREVTVTAGRSLFVRGDEAMLHQALVNLVENAAKYSSEGAPIALSAAERGDRIEIAVEDGGPGIPPEDLPRVFERFYRGRAARRASGSGLGLAIVKGFVELGGGVVRAESAPDRNRFVVTLPSEAAVESTV
jgi:two-component system sensor histidine kinase KdpD